MATLAYARAPRSFSDITARLWPACALIVLFAIYFTHIGTFPKHSLQGIGIPLSVLAVSGAATIYRLVPSWRSIAVGSVIVVVLVAIPVTHQLDQTRTLGSPTIFGSEPYFIRASEQDALNYLARSPVRGAVLSTVYLGQIVPAETGRNTWLGIASWTPAFSRRVTLADQLFSGQMSASRSTTLVRSSGVRFLLADCEHPRNLSVALRTIVQSRLHFGCATVYVLARH
ncbi:MAG TPA: hypothetical protein VEJ87_09820 [Acidimicrobiales bacterium]|nr:hypothetical protein [Acidimicrobiales bacterium]